jgi:hypothetical protein
MVRQRVGCCYYVPGGSTVMLRAIPLLRMLGFWRLHLFGFDSCVDREVPRWRLRRIGSKAWQRDEVTGALLEYDTEEEAKAASAGVCDVWAVLAHHAYVQEENEDEPLFPVECGGRQYWCTPWMVSQASEFRGLVRSLGDEVELAVYGDGLIAQIVKTGASFSTVEE